MSKINNQKHLKNLAQRKDHDKSKTLGHKPANKDTNAKEKKEQDDDNAKCNWNNILLILLKITFFVFINYIIGASTIYYLSHKDVVANLNKDYPIHLDEPPFCFYSADNLDADNIVLGENNKVLAGQCGIIQQLKELFHLIIEGIEAIGSKFDSVFITIKDFIIKQLPQILYVATSVADLAGEATANTPGKATANTPGTGHVKSKKKHKGGAATSPTPTPTPTHPTKSASGTGAKSSHQKPPSNPKSLPKPKHTPTHPTKSASGTGAKSSHQKPPSNPKSLPKPKPRTLKGIADRRTDQKCIGFKWGDGNLMFGEKPGDQSELGDLHLYNGPAWLSPRGTLTMVALAKYQTIMNRWLKWFINPLCSIITPADTDNYFSKAFLGTFSSVIMALFIVYFFITHVFTTIQIFLAILGPELGRYVAGSDNEGTFYCLKETFSWIFAKLIPLIWVPLVTTLFLFVPLLNSVWKFFISPYFTHFIECNKILLQIIEVILFVWLGLLITSYFKNLSSCPDKYFISIFNNKLAPFNMFPPIFAGAASVVLLYTLYSWN